MDTEIRINRQAVRKVAERHASIVRESQARGENAHQAGLDNIDTIRDRLSGQPTELQIAFWETFTQELEALTAHLNDETEKLLIEQTEKENSAEALGAVIGFLVLIGIAALILTY